MKDAVGQKLKEIIDRYGLAVCDDARRCEGLLRDLCPDCKLEINSLISVQKEGIPQELMRSSQVFPLEVTLPKLVKLVMENLGLSQEIARWSVETWASALGVANGRQLEEYLNPENEEGEAFSGASTAEKPKASRGSTSTPVPKPAPQPAQRRLTSSNLRRYSILDTLQHPAALLPLAVCIVSGGYLLLSSPGSAMKWPLVALTAVSGLAAAAAFYLRYPGEYARKSRKLTEKLIAEREQKEEAELRQQAETLQTEFLNVYSVEGTKALNAISSEYPQWEAALGQQKSMDPLATSVLRSLGGETLRAGLNLLSDALDLMKLVQVTGRTRLESEIAAMEREVDLLRKEQNQSERLRFKQDILTSLKERLAALSQLQLCVEQLLHQTGRCEASLRAARIELAAIRTGSSKSSVDAISGALQERINQVKEAQASLMQRAGSLLQENKRQPGSAAEKD
jgi:hypothetical protein